MNDPNARRVEVVHEKGCRCWVDKFGAIYVAQPCWRYGDHVTKRRLSQLAHVLKESKR